MQGPQSWHFTALVGDKGSAVCFTLELKNSGQKVVLGTIVRSQLGV